jgi:pyruvate formate lyase activating enzyme
MFGFIFNIQRYSLHDGPGIRTIVFMTGCPLSCDWCCNPESQQITGALMHNAKTCIRCGRCAAVCPEGAITMTADGPTIDRDKCRLCGTCVSQCPAKAMKISARRVSLAEVMETVVLDRPFYRRSGGGVTFSGGEPLLQPEFVLEGLRESKRQGIGTALETAGHVPFSILESVIPWVDHLLFDVKHLDPDLHKARTGVSNHTILENVRKIAPLARRLVVRVPLIPGFNADDDSVRDIARFATQLDRVTELHLLPYHRMGEAKYAQIDREYQLEDVMPQPEERLRTLAAIVEGEGLICRIRG